MVSDYKRFLSILVLLCLKQSLLNVIIRYWVAQFSGYGLTPDKSKLIREVSRAELVPKSD